MKILLDTHAFIWFLEGNDRLSEKARKNIESDANQIYISIASFWEMAVKVSLGKLDLAIAFDELYTLAMENDIEMLPIQFEHTQLVAQLPFHHKDPFDRMLIAQSLVEQMPILTIDSYFNSYPCKILW
jgi:PIN domain nuclease of toxin-antitoxin system